MKKIKGFRSNVGMIAIHPENNLVLMGKRKPSNNHWQFPQGGIDQGETEIEAMHRELFEETGLKKEDISIVSQSSKTYTYHTPPTYRKYPDVIGQQQRWFLIQLNTIIEEGLVANNEEFVEWRYINFAKSPDIVIPFKKKVYRQVVSEFSKWF